MWTCKTCGERLDDRLETCWRCAGASRPLPEIESTFRAESGAPAPAWRMQFRYFRGTWSSWEGLFQEAAEFASTLGPERVISISHSSDHSDGLVTVWYWVSPDDTRWT